MRRQGMKMTSAIRSNTAPSLRRSAAALVVVLLLGPVAACGGDGQAGQEPLTVGAIPDQDPEVLQRLYGTLSEYLEEELGVPVRYEPVTDYAAAVTAFRVGDLDMVWFGGLTGVQARLQVPGARAILQRGVDDEFRSVFIAHAGSGLAPVDSAEGLRQLEGRTVTFGSEISTSGRLMPEYFLREAGVHPDQFRGQPGFSGSHDKTIGLVEAGTYQAGALNARVWESRLESGRVDTSKVKVIWRTPPYYDYHWVVRPEVAERYGPDFIQRVKDAFLGLSSEDGETEARILEMFGAEEFIPTDNANYEEIERIGREIGKIE